MNYKTYINLLFLTFIIVLNSCNKSKTIVTNANDYEQFLDHSENKTLKLAQQELNFWSAKYNKAPNQFSYLGPLASAHSTIFEYTGNIKHLKESEEALLIANENTKYQSPGYLQALTRNYIKQHRFNEALALLEKAEALGDKKQATEKMLFDVHMELGNIKAAESYLYTIKSDNDFDFLIRMAKWQDHIGDLDNAIKYMERAKLKAEESKNEQLMLWSYSNLADFYGHAGRIEDSYTHYLKSLELNPNYNYALKGIAWITFSHEKNSEEAKRIIDAIASNYGSPDLYLFKADIAEYEGDFELQKEFLSEYFSKLQANEDEYGDMYNTYNIELFAGNKNEMSKASALANKEIINRATPQSYDLLAWTYYNKGGYSKALEITKKYVENQTFEPAVLYHIAEIYKANGIENEALKKELLASLYELGPNMESKILNL